MHGLTRGRIAKGGNSEASAPGGDGHGEIPIHIGGSRRCERGAVAAIHLHIGNHGADDGLIGFSIHDLAGDGCLGRKCPRTKAQQKGEKEFSVFQFVRF